MSSIRLTSPAKLNLVLDVLGKDQKSGKHFINTVFYRYEGLQDELLMEKGDAEENEVVCSTPGVGPSNLNTVFKALEALGEKGWKVTINKQIPIGAGLGEGSGNAGVVLKYFAEQRGVPVEQMVGMAQEIGADVPFFMIDDNLAYAEGFGDQMVQSWTIDPLPIELVRTGITVSTAEAYGGLDLSRCGLYSVKTEALLRQLNDGGQLTPADWRQYIHNDFEASFFSRHPGLKDEGWLCGSGGMLWRFSA